MLNNIKELRMKRGLLQKELAEAIGVTQSTVSGWEIGAYFPATSKLPALAEILGCTVADILEGVEYDRVYC